MHRLIRQCRKLRPVSIGLFVWLVFPLCCRAATTDTHSTVHTGTSVHTKQALKKKPHHSAVIIHKKQLHKNKQSRPIVDKHKKKLTKKKSLRSSEVAHNRPMLKKEKHHPFDAVHNKQALHKKQHRTSGSRHKKPLPEITLVQFHGTKRCTTKTAIRQTGTAVWYGPGFYRKKTASGDCLDTVECTAAHRSLPFNTIVRVINLDNGDTVMVRINDRGPFRGKHCIDLSPAAAKKIGLHKTHTARVRIERIIEETT